MSTPRRFPTEREIDEWMTAHLVDSKQPLDAHMDQLKAAAYDADRRFVGGSVHAVATGRAEWALVDTPGAHDVVPHDAQRSAARAYLAAVSAGITPLCPHVNQIRPLTLLCDPPVVMCSSCAPRVLRTPPPFHYDHQCDLCGAHSETLAEMGTMLGHIAIWGHVCPRCGDEQLQRATRQARRVMPIGRNRPCPCGSRRKYKHCCGPRTGVA